MTFDTIQVAGSDALSKLQELRQERPNTGRYPFLIGDEDELETLEEMGEEAGSPDQAIAQSLAYNVEQEIDEIREELLDEGEEGLLGEWPEELPEPAAITLDKDILTGEFHPTVFVGFAEIEHAWHLPAWLNYGAWNECPSPAVHCAFHRKWQTEYGAEIIGMSGSVIECVVQKPPTTRKAAIELAIQQYRYCPDIVDQGCGTVSNLASTLLKAKYWYFWWD